METADTMPNAARALAAISPSLDPSSIGIVVCIPCFRRPQHLRQTLESLASQRTGHRFAVVMVENDALRSESVPVATEFLASNKLPGLCVVEPRQGNCHAINAAFETALATFPAAASFLMIDDDEIASPDWLERMILTAEATGADIVGGPVMPDFDDARKRGLRRHPAFAPAYDTSGPVPVIYGCGNCLIRRSVFERVDAPAFDLRFNFLGGGDTDFFYRCLRLGMRFHWVAEATISETVPPSRTKLSWLISRGLRIGAINYHVQRKATPTLWLRARLTLKLLAAFPLSFLQAARAALIERDRIIAMHPMTVAIGSVLAAVGIEPQPYKASKIT
ncbi:glycosyltransferase family 2 protein [Bradyrhizobium sp. AUGA SZCCT0177]|uniref:glycosyltransferase family 2 protein n=1 Tax=Bradyrhizobium sp. AUGA SZCCT0177 TaxID=2807665 RepID=UPI001BAC56BB|nr:glycosyltransferase [Bradyrhizobium sp. AUGA SZCCT0177]MBR1281200.1 glycosyltransferase family 2 protein [Bradyrhizobium sp. AUGA SZCCT0177]